MIIGLSGSLPSSLSHGLAAEGVPKAVAEKIGNLPPVSTLFAAFLGYNPLAHLLPASVLSSLPHAKSAVITGRSFFPGLIAVPFRSGLHAAFDFAALGCAIAAVASWSRGKRYVYHAEPAAATSAASAASAAPVPVPAAAAPAPAARSGRFDPSSAAPTAGASAQTDGADLADGVTTVGVDAGNGAGAPPPLSAPHGAKSSGNGSQLPPQSGPTGTAANREPLAGRPRRRRPGLSTVITPIFG